MHSILVVGSDPAIRNLVTTVLERRGLTVSTVADGRAALEAIAQAPPDAVLADASPPWLNPPAFVRALRKREPTISIGLMSIDPDEAANAGVPTLPMPFTIAALFEFATMLLTERVRG